MPLPDGEPRPPAPPPSEHLTAEVDALAAMLPLAQVPVGEDPSAPGHTPEDASPPAGGSPLTPG